MPKTVNDIKALAPFGRAVPGHRIRIALKEVADKIGSIHLPDQTKRDKELTSGVGQVVAVGETAYTGDQFLGGKPWVAVGDWVLINKFAGRKYREDGKPYVIVNDDEIIDVIPSPDSLADF